MTTADIVLIEVTKEHKEALQKGIPHLATLLNLKVPTGWPEFPEAFDVSAEATPMNTGWPAFFFTLPFEQALIGNGGFAGAPNEVGEVEIGYEIAPEFRNRGFATVAAQALMQIAFSHSEVQAVVAHTLAQKNASNAVLKKVGMSFVEELPNPEVGAVWLWRKSRIE